MAATQRDASQGELLDWLEQITAEERVALLQRDWDALQRVIATKDDVATKLQNVLAECNEKAGLNDAARREQFLKIQKATNHNSQLAKRLSHQLARLGRKGRRSGFYDRTARLSVNPRVALHCVG